MENKTAHLAKHYQMEKETLQQLLQLEKAFRAHYMLLRNESQIQKDIVGRMWVVSQRYIISIGTGLCSKFSEYYAAPAEETLIHEFHDKLQLLDASNGRIMDSLHALHSSCQVFEKLCSQLDMSIESAFIIGDTFHKPITYFIEMIADIFNYFHAIALKYWYRSKLLEPADSIPLEEYKNILEASEDFEEYLMMSLNYCKCLKPKIPC